MKEELLAKCLEIKVYPTKFNIKEICGISISTLRRKGFVLSELQKEYRLRIKENIICLHCGVLCKSKHSKKFCSHSCSASFNNPLTKILNNCNNCDKIIPAISTYCSTSCQREYEYYTRIINWKLGFEVYSTRTNFMRKYLFEKYDNKCSCCGWSKRNKFSNKIPLEVDHIDGNSQNNVESNLTLLCPNCHSLTPTYKSLNKGNGRHNRMKRYKEGKSY